MISAAATNAILKTEKYANLIHGVLCDLPLASVVIASSAGVRFSVWAWALGIAFIVSGCFARYYARKEIIR